VRYDGTFLTRIGLQVFLASGAPGGQPS